MRKTVIAAVALAGAFGLASSATAGVYQDDLTRCIVKSATPSDQTAFVQWLFSVIALHPSVEEMAKITPAQRMALEKTSAKLFQRLVITDCHKETVDTLKYEGTGALQQSFQVLGQVAMRNLMTDSKVGAGIADLGANMDDAAWTDLAKEAGATTAGAK